MPRDIRRIAYFCMEVGSVSEMPTYGGGLGVLAGDTIRTAADFHVPMVAVTLLHRRGYFRQLLDAAGSQREEPAEWVVEDFARETPGRAIVNIEDRPVHIRAWVRDVAGLGGYSVPVYYLDTRLPENAEQDRGLTDFLYGGDAHYRLRQEILLGIGGVRILRALGYQGLQRFHINEGHAALLALELLDERLRESGRRDLNPEDVETVRRHCAFTTHTPVPAGHDQFPSDTALPILGSHAATLLKNLACLNGTLNMTHLALRLSGFVNAVSRRHGEVSRRLFATHQVDAITNGVHPPTWVATEFKELFDRYTPGWREDNYALRFALKIPHYEFWGAHMAAKQRLLEHVGKTTGTHLDLNAFTIGFARRAALYKRADLFFHDINRLRRIHEQVGAVQIIYAGKAHPHDQAAKDLIRRVYQAKESLRDSVKVIYLPDYDMRLCGLMTAGVDLWLNTPKPPLEASGTSGMKAAMNGVPSLSILDGWWVEGCIEGVTGWAIGEDGHEFDANNEAAETARIVYDKLEYVILPLYYTKRYAYTDVMRHAVCINGPHFSTQRMMQQYLMHY